MSSQDVDDRVAALEAKTKELLDLVERQQRRITALQQASDSPAAKLAVRHRPDYHKLRTFSYKDDKEHRSMLVSRILRVDSDVTEEEIEEVDDEDDDDDSKEPHSARSGTSMGSAYGYGDEVQYLEAPRKLVEHMKSYLVWAAKHELIHETQLPALLTNLPLEAVYEVADNRSPLEDLLSELEDPVSGVKVGKRRHMFKHYHNVFVGKEAVDWMIDHGYAKSRQEAVERGRDLVDHGFVVHVRAERNFEDSKMFYRFTRNKHSLVSVMRRLRPPDTTGKDPLTSSLIKLIYHIHEGTVPEWLLDVSPDNLALCYPAVLLWAEGHHDDKDKEEVKNTLENLISEHPQLRLPVYGFAVTSGIEQSLNVKKLKWTKEEQATLSVVKAAPPAKYIKAINAKGQPCIHPFTGEKATKVTVKKEFTSNAKPAWIQMQDSKGATIPPDLVAKVGDDLRKDLAVQLIFKACEALWECSRVHWRLGRAPYVRTYKVMVASDNGGFLQFMPGEVVKDVAANKRWKDVNLKAFCPSAVGTMCAGFILGVRDRHSENWMLLGNPATNPELLQIDFGYMFMENPGGLALDTPRLTMQPELIKLLKRRQGKDFKTTLMEDFQADLVQAYMVLRKHHPALVSFCKSVLSGLYTEQQVESFMWGKHVFRVGQEEHQVNSWFEDKVLNQLTKFVFRRTAKHALVRAYYGAKKMGI